MMDRRMFLQSAAIAAAASFTASGAARGPFGLGINTYSLRGLKLNDRGYLDRAAAWNLDALFLQVTFDPGAEDPKHWAEVKAWTKDLGLRFETGGNMIVPSKPEFFDQSVATLRHSIQRAAAMGSPICRSICGTWRNELVMPTAEETIEVAVGVLKAVKSQAVDAGVKIAIEVHKDFQAWEHKMLIDEAGKDSVGTYLDTGNPVFVMEDPLLTLETLAPYVVSFHLRDSVVYEVPDGIAVQWVPLGDGMIDFKRIMAVARERLAPDVYAYVKPITGQPIAILPIYDQAHWKRYYPRARAGELTRFMKLAKGGKPYLRPMVVEDIRGRKIPEAYQAALTYQQMEHMERSLKYAREVLGLGLKPAPG